LSAVDPGSGKPEASVFYVAYTLDNQDVAKRPVTFLYNGGPGSSSAYLHLGSFGPRRLVTGDPSAAPIKPFPLVDNAESLLDVSDLVFVDAVGTGYSEAIAPFNNQSFWSVDADANLFRDFVVRYLAANARQSSPKALFGESYGTLRSLVLADALENAGIKVDGVVLQSSILNYNSNCGVFDPGVVSCAGYLPSYGVVGAYFGRVQPAPADAASYAQQMRGLAANSYDAAVAAFLSSSHTPPPAGLTDQLAGATGIASSIWQAHFDLDPDSFRADLLAGSLIGRYDARVQVNANSPLTTGGDPSINIVDPEFTSAIQAYLPQFLRYSNGSAYSLFSNAINKWDFTHAKLALPDGIPDLAAAMTLNPSMRVLSVNGYHDLATPFHQTERDLARLGSVPNVAIKIYAGGHMTYLDDGSRPLEKADLSAFYAALGR
jgi:carboxypeptidase C (cathepsin A)